jgi:hypothetical protein
MAQVSWLALTVKPGLVEIDKRDERVRKGTHFAKKVRLADKNPEPSYRLEDLYAELRKKSRVERERAMTMQEQAEGLFYCRICGEQCDQERRCPDHGRQYGKSGGR